MDPWDYMRFVYMTEEIVLVGSMPTGPSVYDYPNPDIPETTPTTGSGGGTLPRPLVPTDRSGQAQDEMLQAGSWVVDPCWMLNDYAGLTTFKEGGEEKVIQGEMALSRGPFSKVRTTYGWGTHGDGAWPWCFQGTKIELVSMNSDGQESTFCQTFGWTLTKCRVPGQAFPLDVGECKGPSIGGDSSRADYNQIATMWQRFETCMRGYFPDCGSGEEGES